jgi:hypothetical protein
MDTSNLASQHASEFLFALGKVSRRLMDQAIMLRHNSLVQGVITDWRPQVYSNKQGCIVEGYVDTELKDGSNITWHIELYWQDNQWLLEYFITGIPNIPPYSQQRLHAFPDLISISLSDCIRHLHEAIDLLFTQSLEAMIDLNI